MKLKSALLFSAFLLASVFSVSAQSFDLPTNVSFKTKEDFSGYEKDIIAAAKWLEATPVGQENEKRVLVNAFVLQWLTGSPAVTMEINKFAMDVTDKNPMLNMMLIAGYVRWVLENNYSTDKIKAYTAGVHSVINLYNLGGEVKKNKKLTTAIEKDKEGKLEDWVADNLK